MLEAGWKSVKEPFNFNKYQFELDETARKFECGSLLFPLIYGLGASLDLIKEIGIYRIEKRILELTRFLVENLTKLNIEILSPLEEKYRSGIVSFKFGIRRNYLKF